MATVLAEIGKDGSVTVADTAPKISITSTAAQEAVEAKPEELLKDKKKDERKFAEIVVISDLQSNVVEGYDFACPVNQQVFWLYRHLQEKRDTMLICGIASDASLKNKFEIGNYNDAIAYGEYSPKINWDKVSLIIDFSQEKRSYKMAQEHKTKVLYVNHPLFHQYKKAPPLKHPSMTGVSSEHCMDVSGRLGVPVLTLPFGVEIIGERPKREDKQHVLYFGRITKERGCHEAIRITRKKKLDLVIAGDDKTVDDQEYVYRILQEADGHNVKYLGSVHDTTKQKLIAEASVLLVPYLTDEDAWSCQTLKLALALGVPAATTAKGSLNGATPFCSSYRTLEEMESEDFVALGRIAKVDSSMWKPQYASFEELIERAMSDPW